MIQDPTTPLHWRPQTFGRRRAKEIGDPVIEPLWTGVRLLAHVAAGSVDLREATGEQASRQDDGEVADAIGRVVRAESAVLDGYLTTQAAQSGVGVHVGPAAESPTPGDIARQMLLGSPRNRRAELVDALEDAAGPPEEPTGNAVFVAVDLLLLDGEPLLDIPLLERKRLLDGVVVPNHHVRVGVYVRPPVDPWLGTWRTIGFRQLAYKDANGRYRPGEASDGWATSDIPRA